MKKINNAKEIIDKNYSSANILIKFFLNNFTNKIKKSLQDISADRLIGLDIGCGEGHLLSFLFKENVLKKITAIDINFNKLLYAIYNYPFFNYVQGDIHELPFSENTFDFIVANEVLEHIKEPRKAMMEFRRICKKNAWLILSVPDEPFFSLGNMLRGKYLKNRGRTPAHISFWRKKEFEKFISEFAIVKNQYSLSVFPWLLYSGQIKK